MKVGRGPLVTIALALAAAFHPHVHALAAPSLQAANRRQGYDTTFRREGIEIVAAEPAASWRLGVSVTGYGRDGDVRPLPPAEPRMEKDRVEYRRGPVTEWYVNRPAGLEQGFELQEPRPRGTGPLVVAMAVRGDLDVVASGHAASFTRGSGETPVRYTGLRAWDASGRRLRTRLEAADRSLRLIVEAEGARFPLTVDPVFVHELVHAHRLALDALDPRLQLLRLLPGKTDGDLQARQR